MSCWFRERCNHNHSFNDQIFWRNNPKKKRGRKQKQKEFLNNDSEDEERKDKKDRWIKGFINLSRSYSKVRK